DRATLAEKIIRERAELFGIPTDELRFHYIGYNSTRPWWTPEHEPPEIRLRATISALDEEPALWLCREIEALYTNGPAGGGGVETSVRETIGIVSCFIPRNVVHQRVEVV